MRVPAGEARAGTVAIKVLSLARVPDARAAVAQSAKATVLTNHPNAMPLLERNVRRNSALFEPVGKKRKKRGDANADAETTTTTIKPIKPKCMPLDWTNDAHVDAVARKVPSRSYWPRTSCSAGRRDAAARTLRAYGGQARVCLPSGAMRGRVWRFGGWRRRRWVRRGRFRGRSSGSWTRSASCQAQGHDGRVRGCARELSVE